MAIGREIEWATHQPLNYGAKSRLLGAVVRKVRDAMLEFWCADQNRQRVGGESPPR
jgi:hypothetical protein